MQVLIAERKGAKAAREGRVPFEEGLRKGTIIVLAAPLDASSQDMIAFPELSLLNPSALLINIARGGIVNEQDLATALRSGKIGGAACDCFSTEPATKENCVLLEEGIPNLVLSPHVAWYSSKTIKGTIEVQKKNLEGFVGGRAVNVVP